MTLESTQTSWKPSHNRWLIAWVITLATFMEILDMSIANVALPHIAGNLSASINESTWVLTSYLVANAVILPLSGWFSSLFGRKRFYMGCVVLFTVSSLLCGLATNLETLILFRILQGIGGGGLQPSEQAILVDTFPGEKLGMGMAIYGFAIVTAPIIGPTLGGWITDNFSWRWIFFINIPVGILSLLMTSQVVEDPPYLKRYPFKEGLKKIDYWGIIFLSLGIGALQVVLDTGERKNWFDSNFITFFSITSLLSLIAAFFWEWRQKEPAVDLKLLKDRNFFFGNVTMFMLGFILFGSTVLIPLFLQTLMGYSALESGLVLSPGAMVSMAMMPLVGILVSKMQPKWLIIAGLGIVSFSLIHMSNFNLYIDPHHAMFARMIQSFGFSLLFVPINTAAFAYVPKEKANNATGIINLSRNIGGSVGIAFVATLLTRRSQMHQNELVHHFVPSNPYYLQLLEQAKQISIHHGATTVQATKQAYGIVYSMFERQASMQSFIDNFWILGLIFMGMIPVIFFLKKNSLGKKGIIAH